MSFGISEIVVNRIRKGKTKWQISVQPAFYKVETSLTRANNEVSKSMERLATGKQNANAGDNILRDGRHVPIRLCRYKSGYQAPLL